MILKHVKIASTLLILSPLMESILPSSSWAMSAEDMEKEGIPITSSRFSKRFRDHLKQNFLKEIGDNVVEYCNNSFRKDNSEDSMTIIDIEHSGMFFTREFNQLEDGFQCLFYVQFPLEFLEKTQTPLKELVQNLKKLRYEESDKLAEEFYNIEGVNPYKNNLDLFLKHRRTPFYGMSFLTSKHQFEIILKNYDINEINFKNFINNCNMYFDFCVPLNTVDLKKLPEAEQEANHLYNNFLQIDRNIYFNEIPKEVKGFIFSKLI